MGTNGGADTWPQLEKLLDLSHCAQVRLELTLNNADNYRITRGRWLFCVAVRLVKLGVYVICTASEWRLLKRLCGRKESQIRIKSVR